MGKTSRSSSDWVLRKRLSNSRVYKERDFKILSEGPCKDEGKIPETEESIL